MMMVQPELEYLITSTFIQACKINNIDFINFCSNEYLKLKLPTYRWNQLVWRGIDESCSLRNSELLTHLLSLLVVDGYNAVREINLMELSDLDPLNFNKPDIEKAIFLDACKTNNRGLIDYCIKLYSGSIRNSLVWRGIDCSRPLRDSDLITHLLSLLEKSIVLQIHYKVSGFDHGFDHDGICCSDYDFDDDGIPDEWSEDEVLTTNNYGKNDFHNGYLKGDLLKTYDSHHDGCTSGGAGNCLGCYQDKKAIYGKIITN